VAEWDLDAEAWWSDLDAAVLTCLQAHGAMAPIEIGHHLGLSESAVTSLLCLLVQDGKVRICLVEDGAHHAASARAA
jgi:hypothetical protein